MPVIHVTEPGFQTTVQDLGRTGCADFGLSLSGAADTLSLRLGNLMVGNPENTAALEMTMLGGTFQFEGRALIALTGSDFGSSLDGEPVPNWTPFEVKSGQVLRCGATKAGARCYLCVHGGIDVPEVLGSMSTHLQAGIGGWEGRALKAGDSIATAPPAPPFVTISHVHPQHVGRWLAPDVIRVTWAPQSHWFTSESAERFFREAYMVTESSDRMGIRLSGRKLQMHRSVEMITEGVTPGALQVPPDGQPILLMVEHQTTGGYPKLANVIVADMPRAGQLKPHDHVRFEMIGFDEAREILREQEEWINSLVQVHNI
jgi:antagonist of KipI